MGGGAVGHAHLEKSAALSSCFSSQQAPVGLGQPSTRARQGNLMWLRKNQLGGGRHSQGVGVLVSLKNLERRLAHGAGDHLLLLLLAASGFSDRHSHTPTPPPAGWRQGSLHSHPRPAPVRCGAADRPFDLLAPLRTTTWRWRLAPLRCPLLLYSLRGWRESEEAEPEPEHQAAEARKPRRGPRRGQRGRGLRPSGTDKRDSLSEGAVKESG